MNRELLDLYMRRCLHLAQIGEYYVAPNPMVGAVLVNLDEANGRILGEGWHRQYGGPHAEVNCFADAERRGETDFSRATLFVSLEPCSHYGKTPPCANLIIAKGVRRVVVGILDPNPKVAGKGVQMLKEAGIDVIVGVSENECRYLNRRFLTLQEKKHPYVILKWAQTADGYIDKVREEGCSEGPLVISNAVTKQIVHKMRAENMAIMVGTQTAILDNPSLQVTRWSGRSPIRVVPDRHNRIPQDSKIFSMESETFVYRERTDWQFILTDLASRNIHSILVEGGSRLLQSILATDIYDEIHVEVSPLHLGAGVPAPVVSLPLHYDEIEGNRLYRIMR